MIEPFSVEKMSNKTGFSFFIEKLFLIEPKQ